MAIVKVDDALSTPTKTAPLDGSTAISANALLYADKTNGVAKEMTSTVGDATNILGVSTAAVASGATSVEYIPIVGHELQEWEVDCTNNTAANQLLKNHLLTDELTINNTSTTSADINAVFIATRIVGAAADKKLRGWFAKVGHVTA